MKAALETALGLGLAGIPLAGGGSVCGTMGDYDDELCTRLVDKAQTHGASVNNSQSDIQSTLKCYGFGLLSYFG
jgi:hypothetical protein